MSDLLLIWAACFCTLRTALDLTRLQHDMRLHGVIAWDGTL